MLLDNPADNPCFGCGPHHPHGLRLAFTREGDEVVCTHTPRSTDIGWPGLFHTGLHFSVLYEVSYWGAWELSGAVMNSFGPSTFDQQRLPRTGQPFTARAKVAERSTDGVRIHAWSANHEGKPCATLDTSWRFPSRARMEQAGLKLPEYILRDMKP
ncbi:MAG: hypothetical protein LC624_00815 [Halobacteriales archaeon]|nr:hypothetical protein [Halobacteriales archaeon]